MPSENFLDLNRTKKQAIQEAMCREFLEKPYAEVKASRLAEQAGISRASFYQYFVDKADAFQYVFSVSMKEFLNRIIQSLKQQGGSFFYGFQSLLEELFEDDSGIAYYGLLRKSVTEKECREIAVRVDQQVHDTGEFRKYIHLCYEVLDPERYPALDEEKVAHLMEMGIMILHSMISRWILCKEDKARLLSTAGKQLQILERGAGGKGFDEKVEKLKAGEDSSYEQ